MKFKMLTLVLALGFSVPLHADSGSPYLGSYNITDYDWSDFFTRQGSGPGHWNHRDEQIINGEKVCLNNGREDQCKYLGQVLTVTSPSISCDELQYKNEKGFFESIPLVIGACFTDSYWKTHTDYSLHFCKFDVDCLMEIKKSKDGSFAFYFSWKIQPPLGWDEDKGEIFILKKAD